MKRLLGAVAIAPVATAAGWRLARACAPDFFRAVFSYARHPDMPRPEFIDGRLGVLRPSFARSYLVVAYRYLDGVGMDERDGITIDWPAQWRALRAQVSTPAAPRATLITGGKLAYDTETHTFTLNRAGAPTGWRHTRWRRGVPVLGGGAGRGVFELCWRIVKVTGGCNGGPRRLTFIQGATRRPWWGSGGSRRRMARHGGRFRVTWCCVRCCG